MTHPSDLPPPPTVGIMFDIETLGLDARAVVTQIAMYAFDMEQESIMPDAMHLYLPMQPQFDLVPPRTITADTLVWWMDQPDEARAAFQRSLGDDFEELPILMASLVRRFNKLTNDGIWEYEVMAKGPQFDLTLIETLLTDCGMKAPWKYDRVIDLRTLQRYAGITSKDLTPPEGFIPHRADWDAKFQIQAYFETKRALRARG